MNLRSRRATHIMLNFGTECRIIQTSQLFPQSKRDFNTCGKIATSFTQWPPSSRASSKATPSQTRKSRSSSKTGPLSAVCWQQRTALWLLQKLTAKSQEKLPSNAGQSSETQVLSLGHLVSTFSMMGFVVFICTLVLAAEKLWHQMKEVSIL